MDGRQRTSRCYRIEKIIKTPDFLRDPGSFEPGFFVLFGIFVYQIVIFLLEILKYSSNIYLC